MSALVTEEELQLIKAFILLPMILTAFERDRNKIQETLKTPYPYIETIALAMDKASRTLVSVRRSMRKSGIKVYENNKDEQGIHVKYICKGYYGEMRLLNELLRSECMERMKHLLRS